MNWDVVIQVVGVLLAGPIGAWVVSVQRDKKRLKMEMQRAAAEGRTSEATTMEMVDKVSGEWFKRYDERHQEDQRIIKALKEGFREHRLWDDLVVRKFQELGVDMPPPPELHLEG